ncbi:MAG: 16S rRNA (guanine(527)-N(7))-methyltransferase RsmG [Ferrimicrobium sp.]
MLWNWITRATERGFIAGDKAAHLDHAMAFAQVVERVSPDCSSLCDLGSGGGLPALVIAMVLPHLRVTLIESRLRRAEFLRTQVIELGLDRRVQVLHERAEITARNSPHREGYPLITARSFAATAVTGEIGSCLLQMDGKLVVSEPPDSIVEDRWPSSGLQSVGLRLEETIDAPFHFVVLRKLSRVDLRYPRRPGVLQRRPLF